MSIKKPLFIILGFHLFIFLNGQTPDMILYNGIFFTADDQHPFCEAVSIKDGKILSIGSITDLKKTKDRKTTMIDLKGLFAMPGLIEGHGHFHAMGKNMVDVDLYNTKSWGEIIEMVNNRKKSLPKGEWLEGRGWHQEKWNIQPQVLYQGYPVNKELNALFPKNPVILYHASGHALIANDKALEIAGIDNTTKDPEGGRIIRDKGGYPTGLLEENAMDLLTNALKKHRELQSEEVQYQKWKSNIKLAQQACAKNGITSFHDAGVTVKEVKNYLRLADEKALQIKLWVMINDSLKNIQAFQNRLPIISYAKGLLTVKAIKQYMDGALGSYGALLLEPYTDKPEHTGHIITPMPDLEKMANFAYDHNLQLCIHAIGDKANKEVLNLYERIGKRDILRKDLRWRIEHAQHVSPEDFERFEKLGVIASMQAVHCTSDAPFVEKRLGHQRAQLESYAWRSLIDKGVHIANGTDTPVESVNPFECMYAAVTRKRLDTGLAFYTEQKMTRTEALKSYTIWNAYAGFEEDIKGSITPGKAADIIILDTNLLNCPEEKIATAKVKTTIMNGKTIYNWITLP